MAKKPVAKPAAAKKVAAKPAAKKAAVKKPVAKKAPVEKTTELPKAAVVRIVKKAGAERVGDDAAEAILAAAEAYIAKISAEALAFANHAGRKTIKADDVKLVKL